MPRAYVETDDAGVATSTGRCVDDGSGVTEETGVSTANCSRMRVTRIGAAFIGALLMAALVTACRDSDPQAAEEPEPVPTTSTIPPPRRHLCEVLPEADAEAIVGMDLTRDEIPEEVLDEPGGERLKETCWYVGPLKPDPEGSDLFEAQIGLDYATSGDRARQFFDFVARDAEPVPGLGAEAVWGRLDSSVPYALFILLQNGDLLGVGVSGTTDDRAVSTAIGRAVVDRL